jgi:hypothetical protein
MLQIRFMSLRQWSGPFVEIWIGDYFLAEGRLDAFAGGCTRIREIIYLVNVKNVVTKWLLKVLAVPPATLESKPRVNQKAFFPVPQSVLSFLAHPTFATPT